MKTKVYFYLCAGLMLLSSCNKWFDVTASSDIREKEHYSDIRGFQQTLTGCYIGMSSPALYGKNLSWYTTEILAHQFANSRDITGRNIFAYNYESDDLIRIFQEIWDNAYNIIGNANNALLNLEKEKALLNPIDYAVIKGELLAVRAYLHFDLYRLYGYGSLTERWAQLSSRLTLPYVMVLKKESTPQATVEQFYHNIISDLTQAATLLQEYDPMTGTHPIAFYDEVNTDGFYRYRDLHFNYYAVRGLMARVHLYFGAEDGMQKALDAASEVISFVEKGGYSSSRLSTYVRWLKIDAISSQNTSLATEALMSIEIQDLDKLTENYIKLDYEGDHSLAMYLLPDRVAEIYEQVNTDVRFSKLMHQSVNSQQKGMVPKKMYQRDLDANHRNRIHIIRIPELYYIAAEAHLHHPTPNLAKATELLNTVRQIRGIPDPLGQSLTREELQDELRKEYLKEFMSEGIMFHYYKRLGLQRIPGMTEEDKPLTDEMYVVPFPDFEIQSGRQQKR